MFHFTRKRIEAHICICFVALKVYKELERMLKVSETKMSVDKVLALAKTITTIQIKLPLNKEVYTQTMLMARHQKIAKLFDEEFWVTRWRSQETAVLLSILQVHLPCYECHHKRWQSSKKSELIIQVEFGLQPIETNIRLAILQILKERYKRKSVITTFQLPIAKWIDYIGDSTLADVIMGIWYRMRIKLN